MALAVLQGNKPVIMKREQALRLWEVLQGRKEPENERQEAFAARVKRLYLNREYAPSDYLEMYPSLDSEIQEQELPWYQK